ncbi:AraC family transcriptional regulator [Parapedobacter soli]|uniref:AraC family transcriptional regulator n=1 Tax=Parapedobacter soli TaxID=416955 RepID=UPI0021CA2244|nr:AraC family transcriptional regulator [Parapedobacter soli]
MNPILEKVTVSSNSSFALKEEILPHIKIGWHFHPEYELTLFTESVGKRFVGDHTDSFGPGDLLLIGPHLPHYMRNDEIYYRNDSDLRIRAIVVHFTEDFIGGQFFDIPEMGMVKKLLNNSLRGIHIYGETQQVVAKKMEELLTVEGYERLICLLDILQLIAHSSEQRMLSSIGYENSFSLNDADRINSVFEYVLQHFTEDISLAEVAAHVHMNASAFCKFFKSRTGKTFTYILNEIRIGHACRLFIEQDISVSEVCYACGYNSLSYFNRKFKLITKYSPMDYRRRFYHEPNAAALTLG